VIVRFADDFVVGFEYREDAERFWGIFATGSRRSTWS
jgi:hypothetical protein